MQKTDNICPACGFVTEDGGMAFCPECGGKMQPKPIRAYCAPCGYETDDERMSFCPICGKKLELAAPAKKVCVPCGYETDDERMSFCPICGKKFSDALGADTCCEEAPTRADDLEGGERKPVPEAVEPLDGRDGYTVFCTGCMRDGDGSKRYCTSCGSEYSLICDNCNAFNSFDSTKCAFCGQKFTRSNIPAASRAKRPAKDDAASLSKQAGALKLGKWLLLIASVLMLIVSFLFTEARDEASVIFESFKPALQVFAIGNIICSITVLCVLSSPERYYPARLVDSILGACISGVILVHEVGVIAEAERSVFTVKSFTTVHTAAALITLVVLIADIALIVSSVNSMTKKGG